jgi:peptidylprolyl isomerase
MTRRLFAALSLVPLVCLAGCNGSGSTKSPSDANNPGQPGSTVADKVKSEDVKVGTGQEAKQGDFVYVTYTGKLKNGTIFDSNKKSTGSPFGFAIGGHRVIKGWEEGIAGMKEGGIRKLDIPPSLAYGNNPPGSSIPVNAELFFEVELLAVLKHGDENAFTKKDVTVGSGAEVTNGKTVTLHYVATLVNGRRIDSTIERKKPVTFKLGSGAVIPGLEAGIIGMKVGGERKLRIPPNIGYGEYGMNNVPGNNIVDFDVKLLEVK